MAYICDQSDEQNAPVLDALIRAASTPMEEGVPGMCDECGDPSIRLVGGKCAPCRDVIIEWERRNGRTI